MTNKEAGTLWDRNQPLTFYGNEAKLDDLLGRIWGEVVREVAAETKQGNKKKTKFKAGLGKLIALLGVGDLSAEIGAETNKESISKKVASVPFEAKQNALIEYLLSQGGIPYIDAHNGRKLLQEEGSPVGQWQFESLSGLNKGSYVGILLGLFTASREHPVADGNEDFMDEILHSSKSLWVLNSIQSAKVKAEVPILLENVRLGTQLGMLTISRSWKLNFKVETFALLNWESENRVVCDPISWRIFH